MNAKDFLEKHGRDELKRVAAMAGTKYAYVWQLAEGLRVPSRYMAVRLEAASNGRMDRISLMWPDWHKERS